MSDAWWVPVAGIDELTADTPLAVSCLGEPLVLWQAEGNDAVSAFTDRCPHRGAQLSLGHVQAGQLECPYHGWRFDGTGQCVQVPALPGFMPPAAHRACAYQVRAAHGLWWVAPQGVSTTEPQLPPAFDDLPARRVRCGPYVVEISAPRVVENFLDTAHFGFVHEGWLGARSHLEVPHYEVSTDAHGRPGVPLYRAWQPQASAAAADGTWVDYRYQVLSPFSAVLEKRAEDAMPREAYALWVCPLTPERSRVWFTLFTENQAHDDAALRAFQDRIFSQDRPVLESQRPRTLPVAGGELHCAADRLSVAYRRWLQSTGSLYGCS